MAKTRICQFGQGIKIDIKELIQRLKDDLGLQEHFTYLSSLDEATVSGRGKASMPRPRRWKNCGWGKCQAPPPVASAPLISRPGARGAGRSAAGPSPVEEASR